MNMNMNYNTMDINEVQRNEISISIVSSYEATHGVGRKVGVCSTCKGVHDFYTRIDGMTGFAAVGHACYIGYDYEDMDKNCFLPKEYHSDDETINVNMDGTNNTTTHRLPHLSIEFEIYSSLYGRGRHATQKALGLVEGYPQDIAFTRVYLRLLFIGKKKTGRTNSIECDCTVSAEGHVRFRSLQGLQKFLAGCTKEELECFTDENCGAHIHASCNYAGCTWCDDRVFEPVLSRIMTLSEEERLSLFGSTFRYYARPSVGGHGCTINYCTGYNTIEFRLPRIINAEQYLRVCKWWRAIIAHVNEVGTLVTEGEKKPEKLGKELGKIDVRMNKFSKGR